MVDIIVTPETTPAITPEVTPEVTPTNYFGTDGTLNEGWQSTLDEGYREEASLKTVKDAKTLAKMFVDTKRMVGKDTIAMPSETSTEGEWAEYHKAGGRPETVEDYVLKAPADFPQELVERVFPADRITKWQERFFKGGVSKKAADAFVAEFAQDMLTDIQSAKMAKEQAKAELVKGLSIEYGAAMDQKMHLGDIAVEEGTGGDLAMKESLAYLREDPNAVRLLVNLGAKFAEGKPPNYAAIPTTSDIQSQIDAIAANPLYLSGTQPQRMKLAEQMMALRKKMNPETANTL